MLLGDEGDGEAARGPGKPSLVLNEIERLPCGKGKRNSRFQCTIRTEHDCKHVIVSDTIIQVFLHKKNYLSMG